MPRDRCTTCHGAHWIDPVGNRDPQDAEDCPTCRADYCCDDCGDTSTPAEPTGEERNGWPVHRCRDCQDALRRIDAETEAMSA